MMATTQTPPLLSLPNEILYRILEFAAYNDAHKPHNAILTLSLVSRRLYKVCSDENGSSWREACLALGLPERSRLADIAYPGPHEHRCWREVYKLIWCWSQPFAGEDGDVKSLLTKMVTPETAKKTRRALRKLPQTPGKKLKIVMAMDSPGSKYEADALQDETGEYVEIYTRFSHRHHRASLLDINTAQLSKSINYSTKIPFSTSKLPTNLHRLPSTLNKETSTQTIHRFTLLSLPTGTPLRTLTLTTSPPGRALAAHKTRYTTGFELPFLATSSAIVSGGPDGKLLVWNYFDGSRQGIVGVLPDPNATGDFARRYHGVRVSGCGRYVLGVLSDRVTVWDVVRGECCGSWGSGRVVGKGREWMVDLKDGFGEGVWVVVREEGEEGELEVAYLTGEELGEEESITERLRGVLVEKMGRAWGWVTVNGLIQFGDGVGALVAALFAILVMGVWYVWGVERPVVWQNLLI
ncbi:hypothetical protein BJ508DRAFT_377234 [Ascobolus immersus RN42]|uniref:F-box domain-containing protein n=1 Tax=Ascobolus immersus RN42 TaxID=1160509 RepID=A0A3N4I224_ASCIM|nr:hypothetical protein BJ508DRAFT_377234 [Ascobolus immersus RN42]